MPPSDPTAAKAYGVLDAHCASCHQIGRAPDRQQAGRLANILDLGELARQPEYVRAGVPDGSRLYTTMLDREMPPNARPGAAAAPPPSAAEVQAVRDWIEGLSPGGAQFAGPAGAPGSAESGNPRGTVLTVWAEREAYTAGELLTVLASATADCHLTLINVDRAGKAIVLFPNELEPNNLVAAGLMRQIPMASAPYQLRLSEPGRETIVGLCTPPGAPAAAGIRHDFARQRFTVLGDWRAFLARLLEENGERRTEDAKSGATSGRAKRVRPGASDQTSDTSRGPPARATITIDVR